MWSTETPPVARPEARERPAGPPPMTMTSWMCGPGAEGGDSGCGFGVAVTMRTCRTAGCGSGQRGEAPHQREREGKGISRKRLPA